MTANNISNNYIRKVMGTRNARPIGALLFTNPGYPDIAIDYKVSLTITHIGIYVTGLVPFVVNYVDKSTQQVASELNNSPFPIDIKSLSNIQFLKEGELLASGAIIPTDFDSLDLGSDKRSVIIRAQRWGLRLNETASIQSKAPYPDGPVLPWWPRITVGSFTKKANGIRYLFGVPEYKNQSWSQTSGFPFRDIEGEEVNFVGARKIKTARAPLYRKGNNIVITNADGSRVFPSSVIKDIDTINGYVYLNEGVNIPRNSVIYYTYYEKHYIYKDLNVNSHLSQNPSLIDRYVVLYALPISSNSGIQRERGIYHSIGNSIPEAINNITDLGMEEPLAILGAIHVSPAIDITQANIVDTRSYGGGLRTDKFGEAAKERHPITQYFNDLSTYDGIPYHGSAAVAVELPDELMSIMTLDEIKTATKRFVAKGVYTIIDFISSADYWKQTDSNAEVSLVTRPRSREISTRVNLLTYSNSFMGSGAAQAAREGTPWEYSSDTGAYRTEGLTGVVASIEGPVGEQTVWELSLASGSVDFNYLTRSTSNLYQDDTDTFYEGTLDKFGIDQTITAEVKENTSEYFGLYFTDLETDTEFGSVFQWVGGVPVATTNTGEASIIHLRSGWYRCGYSVSSTGNPGLAAVSSNFRGIKIRPVASGAPGQVPSDYYQSGIYIANVQVSDTMHPQAREVVPYLYSGATLDTGQFSFVKLQDSQYGLEKDSLGWINADQNLPLILTGESDTFSFKKSPNLRFGKDISLLPDNSYYIRYIKGSPHTRIFYDDLNLEGKWTSKAHLDKRSIPKHTVAAGKLTFASRGQEIVREVKGFSPLVPRDKDTFIDEVAKELSIIIKDLEALSFKSSNDNGWFQQDYVVDIATGTTGSLLGELAAFVSQPVTRPLYRELLANYNHLATAGFYSVEDDENNLIQQRAQHFYKAVTKTASKSWPQSFNVNIDAFAGFGADTYEHFLDELYVYSKFTKDRMAEYYAISGEAAAVARTGIQTSRSGAFLLAKQIEEITNATISTEIGSNVRSPFIRSQVNIETELSGNYSETHTGLSNQYLATEYVKSFAALYATQDRPTTGQITGEVSLEFNFNPMLIAASGIAHSIHNFERYYGQQIHNGDTRSGQWLYTYNRLDETAGKFLDNISSAFDDIYYGNDEWAGWSGAAENEVKLGPGHALAYSLGLSSGSNFKIDQSFDNDFTHPNNITKSLTNHMQDMVSGYKVAIDSVRPMVESVSNKGGIMTPSMAKLMKSFLWIPTHVAKNEALFEGMYNFRDVRAFEEGMGALVKGLFSEDGNCVEAISFKQEYIGTPYLASEILYNAIEGVDYYNLIGDSGNANRWMGIVQGIWDTTTGLYRDTYGYPSQIIEGSTTGDSGTRLIASMCRILGMKDEPYSTAELALITGVATGRL